MQDTTLVESRALARVVGGDNLAFRNCDKKDAPKMQVSGDCICFNSTDAHYSAAKSA